VTKIIFSVGFASATSSRDSAPSLSRRKKRRGLFPFTHSERWKKIISRTHYHVPQTSEARIVVHKKENGMARNQQKGTKKKKKKQMPLVCTKNRKQERKKKKREASKKKKKKGEGFNQAKPVDTNPKCHKEKNTTKKRWSGTAGVPK
jgi:hypothetical protein